MSILEKLREAQNLCLLTKPTQTRSTSLAISTTGQEYIAGKIESWNHILTISSELAALTLATVQQDYLIKAIHTYVDVDTIEDEISPATIKLLIDHARRTGIDISYTVYNKSGEKVFETVSCQTQFPFYQPKTTILTKVTNASPQQNWLTTNPGSPIQLKEYCIKGSNLAFTTSNTSTAYGSCVVTKSGKIFWGGQYSSYDHRHNLHAEMVAIISTIMLCREPIIYLGILSTKHQETSCNMCGICRQFLLEICTMLESSPQIITFALQTEEHHIYDLNSYLPASWST
jgi:cytidine deaminase